MRIAVVGSGAVGSYYGARLALAGQDVSFLMRSDLDAVRQTGLLLHDNGARLHVPSPRAFPSTADIGPVDLVLIALKATSNNALPLLLPPLLHAETVLLTLQNGLGNEEFLAARFGDGRVFGGVCFACINRIAPGVITNHGDALITLGEHLRPPGPRAQTIHAILADANINIRLIGNLALERWKKLVWNIPFNGLSVVAGGITTDRILADPALLARVSALMAEVIAIGRALGFDIDPSYAEEQIRRTVPMGAYSPSTLLDHLAGRPLETDPIFAEPLRRARMAGIPAPELERLNHQLQTMTVSA